MKRKIKDGLSQEMMHHFKLSSKEYKQLEWIESKEFRLKEEMYDVVYEENISNDSVQLWCINDTQETLLFANLNEHIEQHLDIQKDGKPYSKTLIKLIKIQALLVNSPYVLPIHVNEFSFIDNKYLLASEYIPLILPPPEFNHSFQS